MVDTKKLVAAAVLASSFGLGVLATSSFASGPIVLGPSPAPVVAPVTAVTSTSTPVALQLKALVAYRQIRGFWLSRGIVR
jgi:hypothetical protein